MAKRKKNPSEESVKGPDSGQIPPTGGGETQKGPDSGGTGYYQSGQTPAPGAYNTPSPSGGGGAGYYSGQQAQQYPSYGAPGGISQGANTMHERGKSPSQGGVSQSSSTMAEGAGVPMDKDASIKALIGRTVDRYRIIKLLGEGGFGAVYKAEHTLMKRDVAFKTLHRELGKDPAVLHRFKKEGQVASKFKHKNCIELYDFGQMEDGTFFMAMEFLPGKDLRDILKKKGALEVPECFDVMIQTLAGLQAAHDGGVIHRDLKPDNIKLEEREGRTDFVKILDFGIAKIKEAEAKLDEQTGKMSAAEAANIIKDMPPAPADQGVPEGGYKTQVGAFFGTPEYGSPEQCAGEEIDARSDLYTMGCILYECLTGSLPFVSKTPQGYLAQHMVAPPRPISEIRPDLKIPPEVEAVIMKALEKRREDRYQTAAEFAQAMVDCAQKVGIPITVEGGGIVVQKTPAWKIALMAGVPLAIAAGVLIYVRVTTKDPEFAGIQENVAKLVTAYKYDEAFILLEDGGGNKRVHDEFLPWFSEQLGVVGEKRRGRQLEFDGALAEIKAGYDDLTPEERVYDKWIDRLGTVANKEVFSADAAPKLNDQLKDRQARIQKERDEAADALWRIEEAEIDRLLRDELDVDAARKRLNSFPAKFEKAPTYAYVKDKPKAIDAAASLITEDQKKARIRLIDAGDYGKKNAADWRGRVKQYEDIKRDFPSLATANNSSTLRIKEIHEDWEKVGLERLAPLGAQADAAVKAGTADALVAAWDALETYEEIWKDRPACQQKWQGHKEAVMATGKSQYAAAESQAKKLRREYRPDEGVKLLTQWTTLKHDPATVKKAVRQKSSFDAAITTHAEMVLCPTSDVEIGEDRADLPCGPIQRMKLDAFKVDVTEVTNAQYYTYLSDICKDEDGRLDAEKLKRKAPYVWGANAVSFPDGLALHPVRGVSFGDAVEFANWAGKRLPTEFEWEYAARGPRHQDESKRALNYPFGLAPPPDPATWQAFGCISKKSDAVPTSVVKGYETGRSSPFGLYDMAGNVNEWTSSPYNQYQNPKSEVIDPQYGPERRVARGGSYLTCEGEIRPARCTVRYSHSVTEQPEDVGFRCVKPVSG